MSKVIRFYLVYSSRSPSFQLQYNFSCLKKINKTPFDDTDEYSTHSLLANYLCLGVCIRWTASAPSSSLTCFFFRFISGAYFSYLEEKKWMSRLCGSFRSQTTLQVICYNENIPKRIAPPPLTSI